MSLARRVAITVSVPLLLAVVARVPLPSVEMSAITAAGGRPELAGVLALGLAPYLTAAWLVELTAFLVPAWSHLRHGGPEGRRKLEGWALRLTIVLAAIQGFVFARNLQALEAIPGAMGVVREPGMATALATTFSLVAGIGLQLFLANVITRQGLVNGVVLLFGVSLARDVVGSLAHLAGLARGDGLFTQVPVSPFAALRVVLLAVAVVVATVLVTQRRRRAPTEPAKKAGPYRDARSLATFPEIPIPASSIQTYALAASLLSVPSVLASLRIPGASSLAALLGHAPIFAAVGTALVLVLSVVVAWVLHRPREIAELSRGLGTSDEGARRATTALRHAMPPTLVYVGGIFLVSTAMEGSLSALSVALFTAIVLDVVDAARALRRTASMVPVWEERRAVALPIAAAALREDGIDAEITGTRLLALLQVFAPYAPATIVVPREDEERARVVLRHVLAAGEAPEPRADAPVAPKEPAPSASPLVPLAATFVVGAIVASIAGHAPASPVSGPRPTLELVRVDDESDPLRAVAQEDTPVPGVSIRMESIPSANGPKTVHYARISLAGTTREAALANVGPWLASVPKPEGTRFAFEDVLEPPDGDEGGPESVVAIRTFLLTGKPEITSDDVSDAVLLHSPEGGEVSVSVTLTDAGANRFEAFTRAWTKRRLAIVLDGKVTSAPVIMATIAGGRLSITMGRGDMARQLADGERVVAAFHH